MSVRVEALEAGACEVGEGPHWDAQSGVLLHVNATERQVRRYDPATRTTTAVTLECGPSFVVPVEGRRDAFALGLGLDVAVMTWDGASAAPAAVSVVASVDQEEDKRDNRLNDAKVDPRGRLWTGTMSFKNGTDDYKKDNGSLFSWTGGKTITKHDTGFTLSNGIAWTKDAKTMFFVDSLTYKVFAYDYDIETGSVANRRTAFDFRKLGVPGVPDGLTIDTDDKVWVASFWGGRVVQVDAEAGALLRSVELPAPNVTSLAFGGANLDELYVTTAHITMGDAERRRYPLAGRTFHVTGVGARGFPMRHVALD